MSDERYRTLLRVAYMGNDKVGFIIPAWSPEDAVDVFYEDIPKEVHIEQGLRLIAHVNLGAIRAEDIVISDWQNMPKPHFDADFIREAAGWDEGSMMIHYQEFISSRDLTSDFEDYLYVKMKDEEEMTKETCKCGSGETPILAPCPFAEDIHGDDTECLCCEECRYNCWADI